LPCFLAIETMHPRYGTRNGMWTEVLTINTGYMEANFGGPVWHASVSHRHLSSLTIGERASRAMGVLRGVGDATLGQWVEHTPGATHVRRRLSVAESVGFELRDIRWTDEAARRAQAIPRHLLALVPAHVLAGEVRAS
ncbi:MAG TPA: hypothetical protein VGK49_02880, partial [Ilumatobacteraceae bacterium]